MGVLFKRLSPLLKAVVEHYVDFVDYMVTPNLHPANPRFSEPILPFFPEEQRSEKEKRALPRRSVSLAGETTAGFSGIPDTVQLSDINEHGMYFTSDRKIGIGEVMNLLVTLPAEASPATAPKRVSYRIKVRRVQQLALEGKFGIAASIIGCTVFTDRSAETPQE